MQKEKKLIAPQVEIVFQSTTSLKIIEKIKQNKKDTKQPKHLLYPSKSRISDFALRISAASSLNCLVAAGV